MYAEINKRGRSILHVTYNLSQQMLGDEFLMLKVYPSL